MKNILLLVHDDKGKDARLRAAIDLARALDGHLSCIDVSSLPLSIGADYSGIAEVGIATVDELERVADPIPADIRGFGRAFAWGMQCVDSLDRLLNLQAARVALIEKE